ncbi:MAG: DUF4416 family protein [Spirochaetes bacterium]|nr:DUF4416 family protein [Spirochaetota bacterium]
MRPTRAILFCGLLLNGRADEKEVAETLEREFGRIILKSEPFVFTETDYYKAEMGEGLTRVFVGFDRFIEKELIVDIKRATVDIERERFSEREGRNVNIDPGYLTSAKVVLPTTKNFQHRIYLRDGIFAEVTLRYRRDSFEAWEWTYPDYLRPASIRFFNRLREIYRDRERHGAA